MHTDEVAARLFDPDMAFALAANLAGNLSRGDGGGTLGL
jgi:hypothetical protein